MIPEQISYLRKNTDYHLPFAILQGIPVYPNLITEDPNRDLR